MLLILSCHSVRLLSATSPTRPLTHDLHLCLAFAFRLLHLFNCVTHQPNRHSQQLHEDSEGSSRGQRTDGIDLGLAEEPLTSVCRRTSVVDPCAQRHFYLIRTSGRRRAHSSQLTQTAAIAKVLATNTVSITS